MARNEDAAAKKSHPLAYEDESWHYEDEFSADPRCGLTWRAARNDDDAAAKSHTPWPTSKRDGIMKMSSVLILGVD